MRPAAQTASDARLEGGVDGDHATNHDVSRNMMLGPRLTRDWHGGVASDHVTNHDISRDRRLGPRPTRCGQGGVDGDHASDLAAKSPAP